MTHLEEMLWSSQRDHLRKIRDSKVKTKISLVNQPIWKEVLHECLTLNIETLNLDDTTLKTVGTERRKNVVRKFNVEKMCFSTYSEYKKLKN